MLLKNNTMTATAALVRNSLVLFEKYNGSPAGLLILGWKTYLELDYAVSKELDVSATPSGKSADDAGGILKFNDAVLIVDPSVERRIIPASAHPMVTAIAASKLKLKFPTLSGNKITNDLKTYS